MANFKGPRTPKSTSKDDYQYVPRPLTAMAKEFKDRDRSGVHSHPRAQLLYCVSGVMEVSAARSTWVVPPQRAVWLPPEIRHDMACRGPVSMRTVYVRPDAIPLSFPNRPAIVQVSPLLRELILSAVEMPHLYDEHGRDGLLVSLLLREFAWEEKSLLQMRRPTDQRLDAVYQHFLEAPDTDLTLEQWAANIGISARSLARLIRLETGTSFTCWRQQIRLLSALPRLAAGEPVLKVALDVGYDTPGAFSGMFRKFTGMTPMRYVQTMLR